MAKDDLVREWKTGHEGRTKKGEFVVLKEEPEGFLVQYHSGDWSGRYITMPKVVGRQLTVSESGMPIPSTKKDLESFLDFFYERYPDIYDEVYDEVHSWGKGVSNKQLFAAIQEEHPNLYELIFRSFVKSKK